MSFITELRRRNVFRVAIAYLAAAWLLSEVATTLFPLFGFSDTPARIVVILLAIGFPLFLVFSWIFEITPEGLKLEKDVQREAPIARKADKKLDRAIIVLLILAVGYFAMDKFVLEPARVVEIVEETAQQARSEALVESYGDKSIAVLPFVNMSEDASNEYFSDGISEELLNLLAKIPELRVISRSSAFSFKGKNLEMPEIAKRLNVTKILEGSVRKAGNKVRITAQLIEARSDTHLWSETYDRQLDDIFAIQDEIAATIIEQLKITLLGAVPKVKENNPEAYALFLQARYLGRLGSAEGWKQSDDLYRQALAIDPDYAAAWDGLSGNYINQAGKGLLPFAEGCRLAREAAEKTLAIDPDYAMAQGRLGWIAVWFDNDLAAATRHYEQALALDPTSIYSIGNAAMLLANLGRLNESIALSEYDVARDPVNPISHTNLGSYYYWAGRWDEATASFKTALRLSPDYLGLHYSIGRTLLFKGDAEAALAEFALESDEEYRVKGSALALHDLGRQEEYDVKLRELIERWGGEWPSEVAQVYAHTGDADAAFEWLDKAIGQNEEVLNEQFLEPLYTPLHNDPRWAVFLERVGASPEQLNAIEFQVTLPQ